MKLFLNLVIIIFFNSSSFSQEFVKLKEADKALCNMDTNLSIQILESCLNDSLYMNDLGQIYYSLGKLYQDQGKYNKSIKTFKKGLKYKGRLYYLGNNCHSLPIYTGKEIRKETALSIGQVFIEENQLDSAEFYFHASLNKYKTRYGCGNAIWHQYIQITLKQIDLYLLQGDSLRAQNRLIDILLVNNDFSKQTVKKLKKLLLINYSQKYIETHLLSAIDNITTDKQSEKKVLLRLFNHQTKIRVPRKTLIENKKHLLEHPSIRYLLGKPRIKKSFENSF